MTIERAWVRPSGSTAGESFAAVSITKRREAGSKRNVLPKRLQKAVFSWEVRNAGIGNVEFATAIRLIGPMGECNLL
jgi:hypothetical protein